MTAIQQAPPAESFIARMNREKRERRARLGWPAPTMARPVAKTIGPQRIEIKEVTARDTRVEVVKLANQIVAVTATEIKAAQVLFEPVSKTATIDRIRAEVCIRFHVTKRDLDSDRRDVKVVLPRQVAMYLAAKNTTKSLVAIGKFFARRDHTTVMNAIRRVEKLMETSTIVREHVEVLTKRLNGEVA